MFYATHVSSHLLYAVLQHYCDNVKLRGNRICSSNRRPLSLEELFPHVLSSIKREPTTDVQLQLGRANQPRFSADTRYHGTRAANATYRHANRYSRVYDAPRAYISPYIRAMRGHARALPPHSRGRKAIVICIFVRVHMYKNISRANRVRRFFMAPAFAVLNWFCRLLCGRTVIRNAKSFLRNAFVSAERRRFSQIKLHSGSMRPFIGV